MDFLQHHRGVEALRFESASIAKISKVVTGIDCDTVVLQSPQRHLRTAITAGPVDPRRLPAQFTEKGNSLANQLALFSSREGEHQTLFPALAPSQEVTIEALLGMQMELRVVAASLDRSQGGRHRFVPHVVSTEHLGEERGAEAVVLQDVHNQWDAI